MTESNLECGSNCSCKELEKKVKKLEAALKQEKENVESLKTELDELDDVLKEVESKKDLSKAELKELRDMLLHSLRNSNNVQWRRNLKRLMASIDKVLGE